MSGKSAMKTSAFIDIFGLLVGVCLERVMVSTSMALASGAD